MALKTLPMEEDARILVELPHEKSRLLVHVREDSLSVTSDMCRHRSGPIHLCYTDAAGHRRCPWHDRRITAEERRDDVCAVYWSQRQMLLLVRRDGDATPWPVRKVTP